MLNVKAVGAFLPELALDVYSVLAYCLIKTCHLVCLLLLILL